VKQQLTYRFANWAGLFTNTFFLFFRAYALRACYEGRLEIGGLTAADIVAYVTVSQALLMVIPQWGRIGLSANVRSGQIATDLTRPIDLLQTVLAVRAGVSVYYTFARFFPLMLLGAAVGFVSWPDRVAGAFGFVVSVGLGAWLANLILLLIETSSFWLGTERGMRYRDWWSMVDDRVCPR
jgi:ABC-2 type transport system permease protein